MRVKQPIDNLLGGVSQAPPWKRAANQMGEQINALASRVRGLVKRPPLLAIKDNFIAFQEAAGFHRVDVGDRRFLLVFPSNGSVQVFDLVTGAEQTVGGTGVPFDYLDNLTKPIRAVTVGTRTFMVNPTVTVEETVSEGPTESTKLNEALIWVRAVVSGEEYDAYIDGDQAVPKITAANDSSVDLAQVIADEYNSRAGGLYTATASGPVVHLVRDDGLDFTPIVDGPGEEDLVVIQTSVPDISYLPPAEYVPIGFTVKVIGDPSVEVDDFFMTRGFDSWEETYKPGDDSTLNPDTMPHVIDYDIATDSWNVDRPQWGQREAGDSTTNPRLSIIGSTIDEIFFAEGRLGLVSGNTICMSRSGEPFEFYRETVRAYRDSGPIDITSTANGADKFHSALEWNERPYLFSTTGPFVLHGDPFITPKTVAVLSLGNFRSTDRIRPVSSGDSIFLTTGTSSGPQVLSLSHAEDYPARSSDLTAGMAKYLTGDPVALAVDSDLGFLALVTDSDPSVIYAYSYAIHPNGTPLMSNWSKWQLPPGSVVFDMSMEQGVLSVLLNRVPNAYLANFDVRAAMDDGVPIEADLGTTEYDLEVDLTPIYLRDESGRAETKGRLNVTYLDVLTGPGTTGLEIDVSPPGRTTRTTTYSPSSDEEDLLRVPIMSVGPKTGLKIRCLGTDDCELTGIYWEGFYTDHSQRA